MALFIATLASPHHRHEFWTACLESKGCVRYCGSSCFNKAKRSQKHRNLLPHAAKPLGTSSFDARTIPALSQCCYSNSTETVGDCWTEVPHGCAKFRNTPAATYWSCRRDCDARCDEVGVADEHWRKPLEARRAIEAKAARLKAKARYRDGYKG